MNRILLSSTGGGNMKLKLKGKILLLALIPLAVLGISLGGFTSLNVRNTIQDMSKQQ